MDRLHRSRTQLRGFCAARRAELEELSDEVMRLVGMLDRVNWYRFERDPQLLVAWKTAKQVVSVS